MSPASYLTAPPRDATSIIAHASSGREVSGQAGLLLSAPTAEQPREPETRAQHRDSGDRIQHEVVACDDDRQDDERRVERAGEPDDEPPGPHRHPQPPH